MFYNSVVNYFQKLFKKHCFCSESLVRATVGKEGFPAFPCAMSHIFCAFRGKSFVYRMSSKDSQKC